MDKGRKRVRVLVADDHPLYRDAISRAIADRAELELVGTATDGRDALAQIERLEPDVAVLDIRMPELDGLQVLSELNREQRSTAVLLLSAHVEAELAYEAVAGGARGYLDKGADANEIGDAIVAVARGDTALTTAIQERLASQVHQRARAAEQTPLTERERQVLEMIAEGRSAPEMAEALGLSPATVKAHTRTLYDKLGVAERAAAVAEAMRRGLIE